MKAIVEPAPDASREEVLHLPATHRHVRLATGGWPVVRATLVRRGERGHLLLTLVLPWWARIVRWRRGEPPARAEQRVFRSGAEAETRGRPPIATARFRDRQQALAEHGRLVQALVAGDYEARLVHAFLAMLAPLLEGAAAAAARGDLAAAVASYDDAIARCRAWDPGQAFFTAYQDLYLLRAAALERLDPQRGCEAYRAFIALYARLEYPEAQTIQAAAVARRAVERLARRFR